MGGDYWLSCAGPSDRFGRIAAVTRNHCRLGAKLQVGCSHEVATVPFVPAPGLLYQKFEKMRELGVEHLMQCWYFGNYPGIMNRAAGQLACWNFSGSRTDFLKRLAAPEWGEHAEDMVEAWELCARGYEYYPLSNQFQYYGPVHDGTVWPLHLRRVRRQLPRSWKPDGFPAGDFLSEALRDHSLGEATVLLAKMASLWNAGSAVLEKFALEFQNNPERIADMCVTKALGILFRSAANIFRFYSMRSSLIHGADNTASFLELMEKIVLEEIGQARQLALLCEADPRLGYHSEAEVFKFDASRLRRRADLLETATLADFHECRIALAHGVSFKDFSECRDTLSCKNGQWYANGRLRWKAETTPEIFSVEVCCTDSSDAQEEFLKFYIADEDGERFLFPDIGLARRSHETVDRSGCATLIKTEISGGWTVNMQFPRTRFDGASRILFGVQLVESIQGAERNITFPPGDFSNELRLNLGYFTPDRMVLLDL